MSTTYSGIATVINGNGAVAHVMSHVCGGVIGYPITPSTEISELYEEFRAKGGCNVWGHHPFFFEPEGEHSAQSGALGAALTGGKYISNASSSQGILYGLESHYVTVGKKVGGFVLQIAARVVSRHSLNVMAGHDDVYALLPSGYTILFGSNPQEAADLAAIAYKIAADSLIPVANAMDGFATSHMMSEAALPEPALLRDYLGDPAGRMPCPTVSQEILFGAKGRVYQLMAWLERHAEALPAEARATVERMLADNAEAIETDREGALLPATLEHLPEALHGRWSRLWRNAWEKGTRQRVPALVDVNNPGLTGPVQNQPDFQAGAVDHFTHFAADVPRLARAAMAEYSALTGRDYTPIKPYRCEDAETVMIGLGSVTEDVEAVVDGLRAQGRKVGSISVKLLQPFPEGDIAAALAGKRAVTVLERSDVTALTGLVTRALSKARENANGARHTDIPPVAAPPRLTTAIFGLGGHDLQPRHLVAAFDAMDTPTRSSLVYLGSQFFYTNPPPRLAEAQARLKAAYPDTELMALKTGPNPQLLPDDAFRIRFHSVGGYGTVATGKLLTDILSGVLNLYSKSAPKYGSEKSGAPTNFYITLSPDPVKITNAELEDVEIVLSPDHKVFSHTNPLKGLVEGGTFILQSNLSPLEVWRSLPAVARRDIREKRLKVHVVDAFAVARKHAPSAELETRMMGIAFIGALCGHEARVRHGADEATLLERVRQQIVKKFGSKGEAIVEGNMAVIRDGATATVPLPYDSAEFLDAENANEPGDLRTVALSALPCGLDTGRAPSALFDPGYFDDMIGAAFRDGTIAEAPVMPGAGLFMPPGSGAMKDKGLFRRQVPIFDADKCTGCLECTLVCPDAALPSAVHDIEPLMERALETLDPAAPGTVALAGHMDALYEGIRTVFKAAGNKHKALPDAFAEAAETVIPADAGLSDTVAQVTAALATYPVAKTAMFYSQIERKAPGTGGLFSVALDPWKCSGCLECVTVCAANALEQREQDEATLEMLRDRFEAWSALPNTPERFTEAASGPQAKRMILDRETYYSTTGGHGACRGCGEATAIRQVIAASHSLHRKERDVHREELEGLVDGLTAKLETVTDDVRRARIQATLETLEATLFQLEGGPTGNGPASNMIANATGCSSVYSSTFPFTQYRDPWVNSLFQDTPAVAKGLFEGAAADATAANKAQRIAVLELADAYDPAVHDAALRHFGWESFTPTERKRLPTVFSVGGDGATYDIGFGALSRILATRTPIKMVVLNTGAYSNTGGQASTASLTAQDSDLARVGAAHAGKEDGRKELALLALFHPRVMVVQTAIGLQAHFLKNVLAALTHTSSPALLDIYTPCQGEQGIGDAVATEHARLAVRSRVCPVFVHDPEAGATLAERLNLDGNPSVEDDWTTHKLHYTDADGQTHTLEVPLTPADFAREEGRFRRQVSPRPLAEDAAGMPVHEYIDLSPEARAAVTPFSWAVRAGTLVRLPVSAPIVALVEERRRHWRLLRSLSGQDLARLQASHRAEIEALRAGAVAASDSLESV
ncbi:pyruvate-flavodoxin oxidoreductase [Roseospira marina]|uniref:Pyruvate-flavodoxin oxidoreductase n=1 Tax=Roseospira marina TaxID=140057 RepID=A0A5M6ICM6_9PROT|nr:2-oxoacid:acceptor oxidoreductase family protein [Roseospira marina]KAA5605378.1 pyruvate-flavodoxin oxidoreductase [Roseospira marina]MBB4314636.1 pyruvate-ferredoxin/flavodoxin oxidoreductase [Roseospira marina]MBB5088759.1 pyruvate-ferredoxin/flavodoxin oxidoreductase [Roseospira marina]